MNRLCITHITSVRRYFLHLSCLFSFSQFHNFLLHGGQTKIPLDAIMLQTVPLQDSVYTVRVLTLINLEEGLRQFAGEQGLWQISEVLLQHVRDVVRRLALVVDSSPVCAARLVHLTESLDARFNSRFSEKTHLEKGQREEGLHHVYAHRNLISLALNFNSLISLSITTSTMSDPIIKAYQKVINVPKAR